MMRKLFTVYSKIINIIQRKTPLRENLEKQCTSMSQEEHISPIEILLFAARLISEELENNPAIHRCIRQIISSYFAKGEDLEENQKILNYILCGWEWKYLLQIVLEACGEANKDDLIETAKRMANELIEKYTTASDITVLEGYLQMICLSQNTAYIELLGDIFEMPAVTNNATATERLMNLLDEDDFMRDHAQQIIATIQNRDIGQVLDNKISRRYSRYANRNNSLLSDLNSNINLQAKVRTIYDADIQDIEQFNALESNKHQELNIAICEKLCRDLPKLTQINNNTIRYICSRGYILLGTKGAATPECKAFAVPFLQQESFRDSRFTVPIMIALAEFNEISYTKLFDVINHDPNERIWGGAVGQYFRFRRNLIENNLFKFIGDAIKMRNEQQITQCMRTTYLICKLFNSKKNKLNDENNVDIVNNLENLISSESKDKHSLDTYMYLFDLIDLVASSCPGQAKALLINLDDLKKNIAAMPRSDSLRRQIDQLIKIIDPPSAAR